MAPLSLINLLAISSLAVLACLFPASSVNALATDIHHIRDVSAIGHGAMARRKRATSTNARRCKQRPSSSSTSSKAKPTPAKAKPTPSKAKSASHSSSEKSVATPPASGTAGKGKIGLAWANGNAEPIKPYVNNQVKYIYTWSPNKPTGVDSLGVEFMPMLWGTNQVSQFKQLVKKGYATTVMGFNEPEQPGQSNMSPETGAQLWKEYIQPLANLGYTNLVSPATSSAPSGMTWMKNWYKACKGGCRPNTTGCHYYDITAEGLIAYLTLWHNTFNLDIMLTEFACQNFNDKSKQCSESDVQKFVETVVQFANATPWVKAIIPFGVMHQMQGVNSDNQLMASNGQPNALWQKFINP